jgi:hypothetical protein
MDPFAVRFEAGHARLYTTDIRLLACDGAQGEGGGHGLQLGRRHLLEKGQETVVVVLVNQDQVSRCPCQAAGGP